MTGPLRILHVVGGLGPGNPYGGPATVACDQVVELRSRGHEVDLVAPRIGQPSDDDGVESATSADTFATFRVVPASGFSGLVSPSMTVRIARRLRRYDLVHVHLARDLTTTPAALTALATRVPLVVQTHGMVDASTRRSAALLDAVATRRILRGARAVLCLTESESTDVADVAGTTSIRRTMLPNGVTCPPSPPDPPSARPPMVLFAARLAPRKRPESFVHAARSLIERDVPARFVVAGPDGGLASRVAAEVRAVGRPDLLTMVGPLDRPGVLRALEQATVFVLPSPDEPFAVTVLEALSVARAVIVTESNGLASFVEDHSCGLVVRPDDTTALSAAIESLVRDPVTAAEMGRRGWSAVREHLGIASIVDRLETCYRSAVAGDVVDPTVRRRRARS